jgi:CheY-like chemotaxis protein
MREAIVTVLERQGWATVTVADGAEAVAQLEELRPRLLLIDLMLPRMSGWELLQCLRETQEWREIPTLVLTGFPRENLRVTADAVLHKPVDYDRLVKVIGRLIGSGSARAEQPDRFSDA